jgi:hypothetical protein
MLSFSVPLTYADYCAKVWIDPKESSSKERYNIYYRRFRPKLSLPDKGDDDGEVRLGEPE